MIHMNPDYLPPGLAVPLTIVAWLVYLIVVAVQNRRDELREQAEWARHDAEEAHRG